MTREQHQHRKDEHLSLAVKYWKEGRAQSSFDAVRLLPNALPELSLTDVDLSMPLFGQTFKPPFYIEAMTGGSERGDAINAQLAEIAKNQGLVMAVGSQSIALKYPELAAGFKKVRSINPNGFLFANIGAGHSLENARRAVAMIDANALELHINVAQELAMRDDEGDRSFYWLESINEVASKLEVPVVVKEVGFGMSRRTFEQVAQTAVAAVNVGGRGGTNFAWIEHQRNKAGLDLTDFGLTTVESLLEAQAAGTTKPLIATGGIRSALDIVKSQVLGATLASSAGFILTALIKDGPEAVEALLEDWQADLKKLYVLLGARNLAELREKVQVKRKEQGLS